MNAKYRQYVDGKLNKTSRVEPAETIYKYLDNIQREWSRNLDEVSKNPEAWRGCNNAKELTREQNKLTVITTEDKKIEWIFVELKK